ncbi:sensor histidine kinase [Streptococcus moroccensis]|uniref:histidine kinase n=1 Tax=Streptococcus moroccensis TaxID=1451356 RepID=A0ABT9YP68_9STRE|nr:sensor histidine kinase [Streptococcus moroccensis]MDQ0221785.1 signal transduction histidine kinase [Streptococcus moroccensis]
MIGKFLKEYRLWLLLYPILVLILGITFWLYRLPLATFSNALVFTLTIYVIAIAVLYWQFVQKMSLLSDHKSVKAAETSSPLVQAHLDALEESVSHSKNQQDSLRQERTQLTSLIKMWSHQIKVPLASLDLMVQTERLAPQDVANQVQSIDHYLTMLLNYLKFQEKTDDYRFENLSVKALVSSIIKDYRIQCLSKDLSISISGEWLLNSDRKWLTFAISQIIDNAIKYSRPGGTIVITIDAGSLKISDQGLGILPEDIPRLFEEGFTGFNGHQHHKSTGLGLYMTKLILTELELAVAIESEIDQGTTVTIKPKRKLNDLNTL